MAPLVAPIVAPAVAAYVADVLGVAVESVDPLAGSVANQDFLVRSVDGAAVVVKVGPRSELAAEAWSCRRLSGLGLPVPAISDLDLDHGIDGRPTLIMGFLAGAPSDTQAVMFRAGQAIRRVHGIELAGGGPLVVDGDQAYGLHTTWGDAIGDQLGGLEELVDAGVIDQTLAAGARAAVRVPALLDFAGPGVLLHHDLKPVHVFEVEGELSGIIDWGDASVGDPLGDLARLSMTGPAALNAFAAGYGITITPKISESLARYRILWNVGTLSYEYRAGGDWFDVYRGRIVDDVRALETP